MPTGHKDQRSTQGAITVFTVNKVSRPHLSLALLLPTGHI